MTFLAVTRSAILRAFTALAGRPSAPPPDWVFGPWMSSNEWNTQQRVEQELARTLELDIPATVLVIEAWSDETTFYIWNGAQYTPKAGDGCFRLEDFTFPPTDRGRTPGAWSTSSTRPAFGWCSGRSRRSRRSTSPTPSTTPTSPTPWSAGYVMRR